MHASYKLWKCFFNEKMDAAYGPLQKRNTAFKWIVSKTTNMITYYTQM